MSKDFKNSQIWKDIQENLDLERKLKSEERAKEQLHGILEEIENVDEKIENFFHSKPGAKVTQVLSIQDALETMDVTRKDFDEIKPLIYLFKKRENLENRYLRALERLEGPSTVPSRLRKAYKKLREGY